MITGYVGVAPGTTTLTVPAGPYPMHLVGPQPPAVNTTPVPVPLPTITYEQFLAKDIVLRQEALDMQRRGEMWSRIGVVATASLTTLALIAALGAWWRTGKLQAAVRR